MTLLSRNFTGLVADNTELYIPAMVGGWLARGHHHLRYTYTIEFNGDELLATHFTNFYLDTLVTSVLFSVVVFSHYCNAEVKDGTSIKVLSL